MRLKEAVEKGAEYQKNERLIKEGLGVKESACVGDVVQVIKTLKSHSSALKAVDKTIGLSNPSDSDRLSRLKNAKPANSKGVYYSPIKPADLAAIFSNGGDSGGSGGGGDGSGSSQHSISPECVEEVKCTLAADPKRARHVKAAVASLPPGKLQDILKSCTPTSGNEPEKTWNRSGTMHA
jgi:hypothetical protein